MKFVDLFAGCGGLSYGFFQAGLDLALAVEKSEMAGETYHYNFIGDREIPWDEFLSLDSRRQAEHRLVVNDIRTVMRQRSILRALRKEKVLVLAGGPPCQGFSSAGSRQRKDPRNSLPRLFLRFIDELQPRFIVVENVHGMHIPFLGPSHDSELTDLAWRICSKNYVVQPAELDAAAYGVPQSRRRVFLFCIHATIAPLVGIEDSGDVLDRYRIREIDGSIYHSGAANGKLEKYGGKNGQTPLLVPPPCASSAIRAAGPVFEKIAQTAAGSGLSNHEFRKHSDKTARRFALYHFLARNGIQTTLLYRLSENPRMTKREVVDFLGYDPGNLRLKVLRVPNGRGLETEGKFDNFSEFLAWLRKPKTQKNYGTRKHSQQVIDPGRPSPTVMTIPDDLVHPTENRTLTVREMAKLQGFMNSFVFRGRVTTGGERRKTQVPQYSQVGNAVPPPLARSIGRHLIGLNSRLPKKLQS